MADKMDREEAVEFGGGSIGRFPLSWNYSAAGTVPVDRRYLDLDPDTLVMVLFGMGPETDDLDIISGLAAESCAN